MSLVEGINTLRVKAVVPPDMGLPRPALTVQNSLGDSPRLSSIPGLPAEMTTTHARYYTSDITVGETVIVSATQLLPPDSFITAFTELNYSPGEIGLFVAQYRADIAGMDYEKAVQASARMALGSSERSKLLAERDRKKEVFDALVGVYAHRWEEAKNVGPEEESMQRVTVVEEPSNERRLDPLVRKRLRRVIRHPEDPKSRKLLRENQDLKTAYTEHKAKVRIVNKDIKHARELAGGFVYFFDESLVPLENRGTSEIAEKAKVITDGFSLLVGDTDLITIDQARIRLGRYIESYSRSNYDDAVNTLSNLEDAWPNIEVLQIKGKVTYALGAQAYYTALVDRFGPSHPWQW